jgi:ABC-type phosphate/phosphonate transport system substrate-binding protein
MIGAVAYTANVVEIWEGIRDYFAGTESEMDFVLYSNYGRQVESLLAGHVDIAWNTNLAWARTTAQTVGECRALAMRDTDAAFRTHFVVRKGGGSGELEKLRGRRIALGSRDSAQAAILPLHYLQQAGLAESDVDLMRINSDVGKHGDTGRSEYDALRAVLDDQADVAALGSNTWAAMNREGALADSFDLYWTSPEYSHCNFTALSALSEERAEPWVQRLLAMDWDNPEHRPILEMEGLRRWVLPKLAGYDSLFEAIRLQNIPPTW